MRWSAERFEAVARHSQALHGNRNMLPVAIAVAELGGTLVKAPEVGRELGGRVAPNRVLEALLRLTAIGALAELPYPGRPHPRLFEQLPSPYWTFAREFATDAVSREQVLG